MPLRSLLAILTLLAAAAYAQARQLDIPAKSSVVEGYTPPASASPFTSIEGLWQLTANGGILAIERYQPDYKPLDGTIIYRMVLVHSPALDLRPGAVLGYLAPTAKPHTFDANIYRHHGPDSQMSQPEEFVVTLQENALTLTSVKKGFEVDWSRILDYTVGKQIGIGFVPRILRWRAENRDGLDGCVRYQAPFPRRL